MPRFPRARLALALVPFLAAAVLLGARQFATAPEPVDGARLFRQVFERVAREGLGAQSEDTLFERAARGLLQGIDDPYAELFSPEQLGSFQRNTMRNDYAGVGMQIEAQPGRTVVAAVFPGSPAEQGGVLPGDRIVAVNDSTVKGRGLSEVSGRLLGVAGTTVRVTFERAGVAEPIAMTFTRARIHVPSVPYALMLDGGVGYVPLPRFNNTSAAEVEAAFRDLERRGAKSYVLDLRRNLGGVLEQAADISARPERWLRPGSGPSPLATRCAAFSQGLLPAHPKHETFFAQTCAQTYDDHTGRIPGHPHHRRPRPAALHGSRWTLTSKPLATRAFRSAVASELRSPAPISPAT